MLLFRVAIQPAHQTYLRRVGVTNKQIWRDFDQHNRVIGDVRKEPHSGKQIKLDWLISVDFDSVLTGASRGI